MDEVWVGNIMTPVTRPRGKEFWFCVRYYSHDCKWMIKGSSFPLSIILGQLKFFFSEMLSPTKINQRFFISWLLSK